MEWIRQQLDTKGLSQADLGAAIGLTSVQINKVLTGYRSLKASEADGIRRFFGYELPEDLPTSIAVVGKVGAGDHVQLADDYEKGAGLYTIERPMWIPNHNMAAAEVDGGSAEPWALDGDVIFWRREARGVFEQDLGRVVIAEMDTGEVVLKRLASSPEPNKWSLLSINPTHPNIMDSGVKWASRVVAALPRDQVHVLEA